MNASTIGCSLLMLATAAASASAKEPIDPELWLQQAETAYAQVKRYTAVFHKQQRVAGKLLPEETILLKFRKPSSLYMKWIKAPYKGSELLYVPGWNNDRVRAHRGGLLRMITRDLAPTAPELMADNLRPVTSTGIGFLLESVAKNLRKALKAGHLSFAQPGEERVYGSRTQIVEIGVPAQKAKDYDACRFVVNQDLVTRMLIRIRTYDCRGQLVENYGYEHLDLDAPLSDADFDPKNPAYHF